MIQAADSKSAAPQGRGHTCPKISSESPKRSAKGAGSSVVFASSYLGGGIYLLQSNEHEAHLVTSFLY